MIISEAIKKALEQGCAIKRSSYELYGRILPTNTKSCCIIIFPEEMKKPPAVMWNPSADDLIADDWELTI